MKTVLFYVFIKLASIYLPTYLPGLRNIRLKLFCMHFASFSFPLKKEKRKKQKAIGDENDYFKKMTDDSAF